MSDIGNIDTNWFLSDGPISKVRSDVVRSGRHLTTCYPGPVPILLVCAFLTAKMKERTSHDIELWFSTAVLQTSNSRRVSGFAD